MGLRPNDLEDLVHPIFEIDTYQSKMGDDKDVCVLSFKVKDRMPANDLTSFIEKGFHYVLDADTSSGENNDGEYFVFVEIPRSTHLSNHITEIVHSLEKLSGISEFKFRYFKDNTEHLVEDEYLNTIPNTPEKYEEKIIMHKTESIKKFFNKTLMDDLTLTNNIITIHKPFDRKISFQIIKEGNIEESAPTMLDEASMSEIFWLTKVIGDYNIEKINDNFVLYNKDNSLMVKIL
jgi:hypothetical protein